MLTHLYDLKTSVVSAVEPFKSGSILTRPKMFSVGSVTFSKFLEVGFLKVFYVCLVTTVLHTNALFIKPM